MTNKARKIVKRVTALFLALTIVMSFALTRSSDRVLHATAIDEEEYESIVESEQVAEEENLSFETVEMTLPAEQDSAAAPEPVTEEADETQETAAEPAEESADNANAGDENSLNVAVEGGPNEDASLPEQDSDVNTENADEESEEGAEDTEETEESSAADADGEDREAAEETEEAEAEDAESSEEAADAEPEIEVWHVTFLDTDNQVVDTAEVKKGESLGSLPETIAKEDYIAYWAVGQSAEGGQGTVWTPVARIGAGYTPGSDVTVVPDYDKITRTVTFYSGADLDSAETVASRTVDVDTSYCLNDIPEVPVRPGFAGHWEYSGGVFSNLVPMSEDTAVWAVYDQQIFRVSFLVEGEPYEETTYYSGDTLTLPAAPALAGRTFTGWTAENRIYTGGEPVVSNLTLHATFEDQIVVTFVIRAEDSGMLQDEALVQYFDAGNATIATLPQTPFVADKVFDKWVIEGTDTEVNVGTQVTESMRVVAVFRAFEVYTVTATYYYLNDRGERVDFETQIIEVDRAALPYTLQAPASTKTDGDEVAGAPLYYPETLTVTIEDRDFTDGAYSTEIRYLPGSADYFFVYLLKDLKGSGYSEIAEAREKVTGVLGSYVTPTIKEFDYAVLDSVESAAITEASGQTLAVKYDRKHYTLSYESNGGSFVKGVTAAYETDVAVSTVKPTREGYTFKGWYLDEACTQAAGKTVKLNADTVLYAKWEGQKVNYTIVYLFEKYNEAGTSSSFVYDNSATGTALVGSEVKANDSGIPSKTRSGWEKDADQNSKSVVTIKADGSSVLKVYYKLKEYTFNFNAGKYNSTKTVTAMLNDRGVSGSGTLGYSMKVKLGQDISSAWPTDVTGTYTSGGRNYKVSFNGWTPAGGNTRYVTKRTSVTPDMLPGSGSSITYTAQWTDNAKQYTANYWLQNADDDGYTKSPVYSQTYTSSSGNLSAKEISGYTYHHGNSGAQNTTTYDFYYNRDTFKIDYFDGDQLLKTVSDIKFDADISVDYQLAPSDPEREGVYTWGGWYADAGLTTLYNFSKMPASNLALYAKWIPPQFTVFFDLNGAEGSIADQVQELGSKVDRPANPARTGYVFDGWYTDAEGGELFDWQTQIAADTVLYAHWNHNLIRYTVHYVDESGTELVPDRVVTNPNNQVGDVITEQAVTVAGHRPDAGSKELKLELDGNEITFVYSGKVEKTSYTVRYLLEGTDFAVAPEKTVEDVDGNTLSVLEKAAAVNYAAVAAEYPEYDGLELHPDAAQKELILTAKAEKNVLVFTYSSAKSVTITVNYADMEGNPIPGMAADTRTLKMGNSFTLNRTPIIGWELASAVEGTDLSGTPAGTDYTMTASAVKDGSKVFTLFYQKKLTVTAVSASKQYDGEALTVPDAVSDQVAPEGLLEGDSLSAVSLRFAQQDGAENEPENGRRNAGICVVTPYDAVISGVHSAENYYRIRYLSGTLEVTKISVTVRVEPDRWTNALYIGKPYETGFTNPSKGIEDYVRISHAGYSAKYLDAIWATVAADPALSHTGSEGLGYVAIAESDVGDYSYRLSMTEADLPKDDNYSVALYVRPGRLQILPAALSVTTGSGTKVYDGTALTNPEAGVDGLLEGESVTITATGSQTAPGSSRNDYSITWDHAKEANYIIKNESLGTLTVTSSSVSIAVNNAEHAYTGSSQPGYTADGTFAGSGETVSTDALVVNGLPAGHTLKVSGYTPASGTDVGTYANGSFAGAEIRITDSEGGDVTDCFAVEAVPGTLTVTPAAVTVTARDQSKVYAGSDPVLMADVAGLQGKDDAASISYSVTRDAGENVGSYAIVPSGETEQGNYLVEYVPGTLSIVKATMPLEAEGGSRIYDGTPFAGGAKEGTYPAGTDTVVEYSTDGGSTWSTEAPAITDAGELPYLVRISNPNYETAEVEAVLTVTRKEAVVTAENNGKTYGQPDPELSAQVNGVLQRDLDNGFAVEYTLSRKAGEKVGSYAITASGEAEQGNYLLKYEPGTFTITASGSLAVSVTGYTGPYDGKEHSVVANPSDAEGTTLSYSIDGGQTWSGTAPALTDVGEAAVTVKAENPNYSTATAEAVLHIDPLPVTVKANDAAKVYGDEDPAFTAAVSGVLEGEDASKISYTISRAEGEDAGTYAITPAGEANQGNYTVAYEPGTLTVTPAVFNVGAYNGSKTYDAKPLTGGPAGEVPAGTTVSYSVDGGKTWTDTAPTLTDAGSVPYLVRFENPNYTIPVVPGTLTVTRAEATVTADSKVKTFGSEDPELTAQISGAVAEGEKDSIIYELSRESGENVGTYAIYAKGDAVQGNYSVTYQDAVLTITAADTLSVTAAGFDGEYDGEAHSITAAASVTEGTVLSYSTDGGSTWTEEAPALTDAGEQAVLVRAENKNYTPAEAEAVLKVIPRSITFTAASATREYDGNPLTDTGFSQKGSFVSGQGADVTVSGSQLLPGTSPNVVQYTLFGNTAAGNYNITLVPGVLSVTNRAAKFELTLRPNGSAVTYDGTSRSVNGFESLKFNLGGADFTVEGVSASASGVHAGDYPVAVSGTPVVLDSAGNNVTAQFIVNITDAALTVNPRTLILTSASATAEYSGNALTAETVTVTGDGFAEGEGASYAFTGTRTLVGSSENSFTYAMDPGTDAADYAVSTVFGTLTVTNRNAPYAIEVVANSGSFDYDGRVHEVTGLEHTVFRIEDRTYRVSGLEASASAVHAGSYDVNISGTPVVTDENDNDVSEQFSVTTVPGKLVVNPRALTLLSDSDSKVYDAIPLTAHRVTVSEPGFAPGDSVSYSFTGSRTVVGYEQNSFTYTFNEGTLATDYKLTVNFGTLSVISRPENARFEVTVSADTGSALYDGQPHTLDALRLGDEAVSGGEPLAFTLNGETFALRGLRAARTETDAGNYEVNVTGTPFVTDRAGNDVTDQFVIFPVSGKLSISPRTVVLTSGDAEHAYNGRELRNASVTVSGDGFAEGEGASYSVTGARTLVGESYNEFSYSLNPGTSASNYRISTVFGVLRVLNRDARYEVTIRANSAEVLYNGQAQQVTGFETTSFTQNGVTYTVTGLTASGSGTDAGEYPVHVRGNAAVLDADGNDVTAQFTVRTVPGTLTVRPRSVTLTSATVSREYNGRPFADPEIVISGDGFVGDDGVEIYGSVSRLLVGSSENSFLWEFKSNTNPANYVITTVFGRLSVTNRDALYDITLRANSDSFFYDGEDHSVSGFEATEFDVDGNRYTVLGLTAEATGNEAGVYTTAVTGEAQVLDADGNDVTEQFAVTVENGTLTIHDTYLLTVRFADARYRGAALPDPERDLAPAYSSRYAPGDEYGPIQAPPVGGYTPEYREVRSDDAGMPEHDVTVVVYYAKNTVPVPAGTTDPEEPPENPDDPNRPNPDEEPEGPRPPIGKAVAGDADLVELEAIVDPSVPLARAGAGYWALVNLILVLLTLLLTILLAIVKFVGRDEAEEEEQKVQADEDYRRVSGWMLLLSAIITVLSAVAFYLTEDLTNSMTLVDRWTVLMVIILVVQGLVYLRATRRRDDGEKDGTNPGPGAAADAI